MLRETTPEPRARAVAAESAACSDARGSAPPATEAPGEHPPPHQLIYAVGRLDRGLRVALRRELAELDLTITEFTMLNVLRRRRGLSNAQMARRALVSAQAMNQVLASLEQKGLLIRSSAPIDSGHHRARSVELTAAGEVRAQECKEIAIRVEEKAFRRLGPEGRLSLTTALRDATQALQEPAED